MADRDYPKRTIPKTKVCVSCLERKPASAFGRNPAMVCGLKSYCTECSTRLQKEWRKSNRKTQVRTRKRSSILD